MEIFEELSRNRHENLLYFQHRESSLRGVLAIHDSSLGPAVGGIRCWKYSSEDALIRDALRLAENASLSAALFGCDAGGGKAVIWGNPEDKNETLLRALGIFIHGLGGRFIASPDLGMTSQDMEIIAKETPFVAGLRRGHINEFDYSAITARGILLGMRASAKAVFGSASLKGRKIAIQGLGKVGIALMNLLVEDGAQIYVSDLFFERVKMVKEKNRQAEMVPPNEIPFLPVDIFAPCALGDVLDGETIKKLKCRIVAGAANNQLVSEDVAEAMEQAGILFIPDFLLNAGDIIMVNAELYGIAKEHCVQTIERVYGLVENLITKARTMRKSPYRIAKEWATDRMKGIRTLKKILKVRS